MCGAVATRPLQQDRVFHRRHESATIEVDLSDTSLNAKAATAVLGHLGCEGEPFQLPVGVKGGVYLILAKDFNEVSVPTVGENATKTSLDHRSDFPHKDVKVASSNQV
jgi:hypothetical protein